MLEKLNKIRNADFSRGKTKPVGWSFDGPTRVRWEYHQGDRNGDLAGMAIQTTRAARAGWRQTFRCRKDQYYRFEALISCQCSLDSARAKQNGSATGGLVVTVTMLDAEKKPIGRLQLPPIVSADRLVHRAYFKTCENTRLVEVSVGLQNASGRVVIHEVRVLAVIEPEIKSYPLAVPPPPCADPPPVRVQSILIVSDKPHRAVVDLLSIRFGAKAVSVCSVGEFDPDRVKQDAVILAADVAGKTCNSVRKLMQLARRRVVIASTRWLESITSDAVRTRMVKQIDDPLHARIVHSNYATQGFALHDIVPFAGRTGHSPQMYQRQFRDNPAFRAFCDRHGLEVMLFAVTDSDATSEKPLALFRRTQQGALLVMDVDPVEVADTSTDDATVAMHLLLSALGQSQVSAGQFTDPARNDEELRENLCDLVDRFEGLYWHDGQAPRDLNAPVCIRMGRDLESAGLLIKPRPVILIRTGISGADLEYAYAMMLWLKQLLRPAPHATPYTNLIHSRFRILWKPLCRPPLPWGGWRGDASRSAWKMDVEIEKGAIAGCIDVTETAWHSVRVITAKKDRFSRLLSGALPPLTKALLAGKHFYRAVPTGKHHADRINATWRTDDLVCAFANSKSAFTDPTHRAVQSAGGHCVRLELPSSGVLSAANSLWRTDWALNMIEQIVGLHLGCIMPNRSVDAISLAWPNALSDLVDSIELMAFNSQARNPVRLDSKARVTIPPGHALVAARQPFK